MSFPIGNLVTAEYAQDVVPLQNFDPVRAANARLTTAQVAATQALLTGAWTPILLDTSSQAAATANSALIQANLLLRRGRLLLMADTGTGVAYWNATHTYYSDTELIIGSGLTLRQADNNSNGKTFLQNASYASTVKNVTGAISTGPGVTGLRIATVPCTAHGQSVGGYVLIKNDHTSTYNGVWRVESTPTADSLTFFVNASTDVGTSGGTITFTANVAGLTSGTLTVPLVNGQQPVTFSNGNVRTITIIGGINATWTGALTAGTVTTCTPNLTLATADNNFTLRGPGKIDFNRQNGNSTGALNNVHCVIGNKIGNVDLDHAPEVMNGAKYAYYFCNYDGLRASNIKLNTASDGLHFNGPGWNTQISNIQGQSGDDLVAFTTSNSTAYSAYDTPDGGGNFYGIQLSNLQEWQGTNHRAVLLESENGQGFTGVIVNGVHAHHNGYIGVMVTVPDTYSGFIDSLDIRNITGGYGLTQAAVLISGPTASGTLTIGDISIDGIRPRDSSAFELIVVTGRVTGSAFKASNIIQRPLSLKSAIKFTGSNINWDHIDVDRSRGDFDLITPTINLQLLQLESLIYKTASVRNSRIGGSGSVRTGQFVTIYSPGSKGRIDCIDNYHDGYTYCVLPNVIGAGNEPVITLRGNKHAGVYVISSVDNYTLIFDGGEILACSGGQALNFGGTSKIFNFYMRGIRNTGGVIISTWGGTTNTYNLRESDGSMTFKTDTAGQTMAVSTGCVLNDTQTVAPGVYAKGPTAYTRIAA